MSKRLQVLLDEAEFLHFKKLAAQERIPLGEWVRRLLRKAADSKATGSVESKLKAIHKASTYSFPTGSIEQINEEIERGYSSDLP